MDNNYNTLMRISNNCQIDFSIEAWSSDDFGGVVVTINKHLEDGSIWKMVYKIPREEIRYTKYPGLLLLSIMDKLMDEAEKENTHD